MKKVLVISICIAIILGGVNYFVHARALDELKKSLAYKESLADVKFESEKQELFMKIADRSAESSILFNEIYSKQLAETEIDTTLQTFIFSNKLKYKSLDIAYLDCLFDFCLNEIENERLTKIVLNKLDSIQKKHGLNRAGIMTQMRNEKERFFSSYNNAYCNNYFNDNKDLSIKGNSFVELDKLLAIITQKENEVEIDRVKEYNQFQAELKKAKRSLTSEGKKILEQNFTSSEYTSSNSYSYVGSSLGSINYYIPSTTYPISSLQTAVKNAKEEQYRNNSLRNGAMPYSYCFGAANRGSSKVKVNAGSGDVLVLIKDKSDEVVRHAYIKAHNSFTLDISNGSYNVYFYYGKGWNPNKVIKNNTCEELKGGFHSGEIVQKDPSTLSIYNQIMEYTLTEQINGNFSTASSSKNEAF